MSPDTRDNNRKDGPHGYHEYHLIHSQGAFAVVIEILMTTIAPKRRLHEVGVHFGLQKDSTLAFSHRVAIYKNIDNCLKQEGLEVVARDGIEPPTPAFSGLRSTD